MSEGTAREIVAKAIARSQARPDWAWKPGTMGTDAYLADADAAIEALAQAGALAPAGLTAEQREACGAGADAIRGQVWASEGRQGNPNPDDPQLGTNRMLMDHWRVLRRLAADAATGEPS